MAKCGHCPRAGRPGECLAESTGHRRFCVLVDPTSPDYRPAYVGLLAGAEPRVTAAEAARARRAAKPRVPLGTRPPAAGD